MGHVVSHHCGSLWCAYTQHVSTWSVMWLQVVLMNQVTTKVLGNNQGSKLVPALGMHCTTRLLLYNALQCQ